MEITPTFTINQTKAVTKALQICLQLFQQSPNTAAAFGIGTTEVTHFISSIDRIEKAIPEPSPVQTNEPCNTPPQTTEKPSNESYQKGEQPTPES